MGSYAATSEVAPNARHVTRSKATAVEYSLTRMGRTLIAPLRAMCRWAKRYRKGVTADVYLS
ncbi:MAG TPA: winged helix-turn-helix transcriptional regulator [Terriglobia bacterium]|nr:winged helix-turn-helix transcriptional regulator [Terriglobia bacterium]